MIKTGQFVTRLRVRSLRILALVLLLGGCATRPINPPITQADPHAGYRFETRQANMPRTRTTWSSSPSRAAARVPPRFRMASSNFHAEDGDRRTEGQQGSHARRSRHHHRRVGRQLHCAGLRSLRRQALRRLRAALPEAQCAGRDHLAHLQSGQLDEAWRQRRGVVPNWRQSCTTRYCSTVRRSAISTGDGSADPGVRHRHLDRFALRILAAHLRRHLLGSQCGTPVSRGGVVVGRAGRSLVGHAQQLWWHLPPRHPRPREDVHRHRQPAATSRAGNPLAQGRGSVR